MRVHRLNQTETAELSGISAGELSMLRRQKISPTLSTLLRLAQGFGYTLQVSFVPRKKTNGVRGPKSLHITYDLNPEEETSESSPSPSKLQIVRIKKKSA